MGHGAVRARQPHQHDLRRHQQHPVAGPAGPQGRWATTAPRSKKFGKLVAKLVEEEGVNEKMSRVHQPDRGPGRPAHQVHDRDRLQGLPEPRRGGRRRGGLPARGRPLRVRLPVRPHGAGRRCARSRPATPTRSTSPSCRPPRFYFAKLFPETATLMRTARAGSQGADGHRRRAGLESASFFDQLPGADHESNACSPRSSPLTVGHWPWPRPRPGRGLWRNVDDKTGEAKAEIRIDEASGALLGRIEKSLKKDAKPDARLRRMHRRPQGPADRGPGDHPRRQEG